MQRIIKLEKTKLQERILTTSDTQAESLSQNLIESLSSVTVGVSEPSIRRQVLQQSVMWNILSIIRALELSL